MTPADRKELFSLLSATVSLHDELHITGYHGTRTVKILEIMKQMQTPLKVDVSYKKIQDLHKLSEVEKPLYVGRAIRHIVKQHEEHLGKIEVVQLKKIASSNHSKVSKQQASPELESVNLTNQVKALADMSDEEFKDFLKDLESELVATQSSSSEKNNDSSMSEVLAEQGKELASSVNTKLLKADSKVIGADPKVKVAVSKVVTEICIQLLKETRAEAKREEERAEANREKRDQIERKELQQEIIKSWVSKEAVSKKEITQAVIEKLKEIQTKDNRAEEKQAREDDLTPVAGILVELVWSALPKALRSVGAMDSPSAFDVSKS